MKILAIGDIHLGRTPPSYINDCSLNWFDGLFKNLKEYLISNPVDAIVFAGDLIDNDNDRFEGLSILSNFISSPTLKEVKFFAVAGNHDYSALPSIIQNIPNLTILGKDGVPEDKIIENDCDRVNLLGLSHSKMKIPTADDISSLEELINNQVLNIAILHCDLNGNNSKYFPVPENKIKHSSFDLTLMGHIHKPSPFKNINYGYLGSVMGLDINEQGLHGPVLIETSSNKIISTERISLSPVKWDTIDLDISEIICEDEETYKDTFINFLNNQIQCIISGDTNNSKYRVLVLRVICRGIDKCNFSKQLFYRSLEETSILTHSGIDAIIEKIIDKSYITQSNEFSSNDPISILQSATKILKNEDSLSQFRELISGYGLTIDEVNYISSLSIDDFSDSIDEAIKGVINDLITQRQL